MASRERVVAGAVASMDRWRARGRHPHQAEVREADKEGGRRLAARSWAADVWP